MTDESEAPIETGEELIVEIEDIGTEGDGVARIDSFVVFVPDAELGERVSVRIVEIHDSFAIAESIDDAESM